MRESDAGAPLLEIESLRTYFYSRSKRAFIRAVDGVTLALARGETLGVVGRAGAARASRRSRSQA